MAPSRGDKLTRMCVRRYVPVTSIGIITLGTEWWTVGVRPMRKGRMDANHESTLLEVGYDNEIQQTGDRNNQYKITGRNSGRRRRVSGRVRLSVFSPPTRNAKWDEKWGYIKDGDNISRYAAATNSRHFRTNSRGYDSDEWTFGAQTETGGNTMVIRGTRGVLPPGNIVGLMMLRKPNKAPAAIRLYASGLGAHTATAEPAGLIGLR